MKSKLSIALFLVVLCFLGWFGYSYIGIDKETQVPKALLMKIRPLQTVVNYTDELSGGEKYELGEFFCDTYKEE